MEGNTASRKDQDERERKERKEREEERKEREEERERRQREKEDREREKKERDERAQMEYEQDEESQSLLYLGGKLSLKNIKFGTKEPKLHTPIFIVINKSTISIPNFQIAIINLSY